MSSPIVFLSLQENIMGSGMSRRRESERKNRGEPNSSTKEEAIKFMFSNEYTGYKFDLEELLGASAEVLGKGSYGITYMVTLSNGDSLVVKRLNNEKMKDITETGLEWLIQTNRHRNIVDLIAYHYSKAETLLVYDYYPQSLSDLLSGKRGQSLSDLDLTSRLNIAIGTARGIAHIHKQNDFIFFHGNIKPSNILLNSEGYGCVSGLGLSSLIRNILPLPITNYRVHEEPGNSRASDVYSFGVLLLQLLVQTFEPATSEGEVNDFARWGRSVSKGVETGEVFDRALTDPELRDVLKEAFNLGIQCAQKIPSTRPDMLDVVGKLEKIKERSGKK